MAWYEKLTSMDRVFLDIENNNSHMHVAATLIFEGGPLRKADGGIDIERARRYINSRLHLIPRYRQKLVFAPLTGEPVWVDDRSFNIHYHVRHTGLPRPGDDRCLKRLSGRIMSQQLDRGKPLWECWLVEGLDNDRVAMISKTHHCMIDGISGIDLMSVLLSPFADDEIAEPPHWNPDWAPNGWQVLATETLSRLTAPIGVSRAACGMLRRPLATARKIADGVSAVGEALVATSRRASDTPLNRNIGPHRRFDWLAMPLEQVKAVKNSLGGTVNDVVLATVAGALGRFLARRGIPALRQEELQFRCFCPVSIRSQSERGTLGNRISGMVVDLPIGETDARRRLETVQANTRNVKDSKQALGAEVMAAVSEWTTPTLLSLAARVSTGTRVYNMVVTNVPGPQVPLYMLGAKVIETYPMVPLFESQGLGIALFSYAGGLYWGFNADADVMPDLHDFVQAMAESFADLCQAANLEPQPATNGRANGNHPGLRSGPGNGSSSPLSEGV